ncbi:hypothetical protein, conserved [Eimeria necatrix]|uniref:CCHC-type domain-containing protein n=1 Tax=Eimeria necatrix TaxID=51315 RepID=U6MG61_9EIME|nr:hypothetical protein, conserved [Eimeria necatrix]CDJ63016.1 hypothetical protein, conserved [Eimeria necatrix]
MSPICSDASDTEHLDRSSWAYQRGALIVPPPPPPPPPDDQSHNLSSRNFIPSTGPAVQMCCVQNTPQVAIPLPPADPPNSLEGPKAAEESKRPPTPPWRKNKIFSSHTAGKWQNLFTSTQVSGGQTQERNSSPDSDITLSLRLPLEDPYAFSSIPDPYATTSCYSDNSNSSSAALTGTSFVQPPEPVSGITANAPLSPPSETYLGASSNVPFLLPPSMSHKGLNHANGQSGRPSSSSYVYPPLPAAPPPRERDHWLPPEAHQIRQRLRGRPRSEGMASQGALGGPPPFPFATHYYYPPQQHQQQHPHHDRALLALRRTCYRCRKRGHEASECPSGQGLRQTRSKS